MKRISNPRRPILATAMLAGTLFAVPCIAQTHEPAVPHLASLTTGTLHFPAPGALIVALGVEVLPDITNELAGVRGRMVRWPTLGLKLGLAERAMFQVSWPAYNWLRIAEQREPPPLGRRLGGSSSDWGDVTVATHILLHAEADGGPAWGLRFAAELPTSNEALGIGDNTTDVFASMLLGRAFGDRLGVHADLGVGILTERTRSFAQNDVLTYGVLADWQAGARLHLVGEVAGRWSTRGDLPGTASRSELRAGADLRRGRLHWTALAVHGLTAGDSRGLGASLTVSTRVKVLGAGAPGRSPAL